MTGGSTIVLGDALLDRDIAGPARRLCPDAPAPVVESEEERARPGGAALAALLAARDGRRVVLVTALASDGAGLELRALITGAGVEVVDLGLGGPTPEKVRVLADGRCVARVDRAAEPGPVGPWPDAADDALSAASAVLVADYGRGVAAHPGTGRALAGRRGAVPVVWDPHPAGPPPPPGMGLVTPNRREAALMAPDVDAPGLAGDAARARALAGRWQAAAVAITRGGEGALLSHGEGAPLVVPAPPARGDACGAGDCFSSTAAAFLADGALPSEAVTEAVRRASAFVAAGGASAVGLSPPTPEPGDDPFELAEGVRRRGGTVVAAGGCFDLLHAGHVSMLAAARRLGDCLVVCINSDASVRRLKGPDRPAVPEGDRAAVLAGLACVDAVAIFSEDTPAAVLQRLRPDVFVKGGDYSGGGLPEADVLARWGGQAVVVPFLDGRSSSALLRRRARRPERQDGARRPERQDGARRPERQDGARRPERQDGARRPERQDGARRPERQPSAT